MRALGMFSVLGLCGASVLAQPAPDGFDWVNIGAPGNRAYDGPDPFNRVAGRGGVDYEYRIARTELTSAQALEFFNAAMARPDPLPFASQSWWAAPLLWGGVVDTSYTGPGTRYRLDPSDPNAGIRPVGGLSWRQAAVLCNWLENDKSANADSFMNGAYDATTFTPTPAFPTWNDQPARHPNARYFIPTLDEWMKAVHYDPLANDGAGRWWHQPNGSDVLLTYGPPPVFGGDGVAQANSQFNLPGNAHYRIPLGSYPTLLTPWGLLDAAGGTAEWTEDIFTVDGQMSRGLEGTAWGGATGVGSDAAWGFGTEFPHRRGTYTGIRLASVIPSPAISTFLAAGLLVFSARARPRKSPVPHARHALSIAVLTSTIGHVAHAQTVFELTEIGLADDEHTFPLTGERHLELFPPATPGWIVGVSYQLGVSTNGATIWIADPSSGVTIPISPRDDEHSAPDGMRFASLYWQFPAPESASVLMTADRWVGPDRRGASAWRYQPQTGESIRLGLWDHEHTNASSGEQAATIRLRSIGDDVVGTSRRYVDVWPRGQTAWFCRGTQSSVRIGLADQLHTSPFGDRSSNPTHISASGCTIGTSALYHSAPMAPGQSVWRFEPQSGTATRIGLLGSEYIDASGYHYSIPRDLDEDGNAYGESERYIGGLYKGVDAWVSELSAGSAILIALSDVEHTSASGVRSSRFQSVPSSGFMFGASTRYNGGWIGLGDTAWMFEVETRRFTRVGLSDAVHTSSNGSRFSGLTHRLSDGRLVGWSRRFRAASNSPNGNTAWLYDPVTVEYRVLGYTDAEHTTPSNGFRDSQVFGISPNDIVFGLSARGSGDTVWRYDPIAHVITQTGALTAEHTEPNGYADGDWMYVRDARAFGSTSRLASAGGGTTPWYFEYATGAVRWPGLDDPRHRSSSGLVQSWLNTNFVGNYTFGESVRFNGAVEVGQTAFVHDASNDTTRPIVLAETPDGFAFTNLGFVTSGGAGLGVYRDMSMAPDQQYRVFYLEGTSALPLDELVIGGFESAGYRNSPYGIGSTEFWELSDEVFFGEMGRIDRPGNHGYMLRRRSLCDPDVNCDGSPDQGDVACMITAIAGDLSCYRPHDADFNRDGSADQADIADLISVIAGAPCPW